MRKVCIARNLAVRIQPFELSNTLPHASRGTVELVSARIDRTATRARTQLDDEVAFRSYIHSQERPSN
jgi:hypothetical protein